MSALKITVHMVVKNEDQWIWYAIKSVLPFIDKILIWDTGSTDNTIPIINALNSPKIKLEKRSHVDRNDLVNLRHQQITQTTTPWFMLLDGDEIWPTKNLRKLLHTAITTSPTTWAVYTHTRNCVGDIYHYLPESKGHYQIGNHTGHLNIRLIRNLPGLTVSGTYPLEAYSYQGKPLQVQSEHLQYLNTWYLHVTHLRRSTIKESEAHVIDRLKKRKFRLGTKMPKEELPVVFWQPHPKIVPPPITNRWTELFQGITLKRA